MANYENVCKNARETLKQSLLARGKEQLKHRPQQRNSVCEMLYFLDDALHYFISFFFKFILQYESTFLILIFLTYFTFIFFIHHRLSKKIQVHK